MLTFGEKIRKLRVEKGVPLRLVASYLGMDQAILSKIERGIRQATRKMVVKLAAFYEVDSNELLTSWLSDRILYEVGDDEVALEAIRLAEEKVSYLTLKAPLLETIIPQLSEVLSKDTRVTKAWIFGSVARGEADYKSDIDLMIQVDDTRNFGLFDLADIQYYGEQLTGFKIDLVMEGAVKSFAKESVDRDKLLIYEKPTSE